MDIVDYPELPQKERILKIAAQLFAKRGFHAVGMSDLQDAVKLGRGALYHHIRSKEDLLYEISREYIRDLAQSAAQLLVEVRDPSERVQRLGTYLVRKIASHQAELTVCFREIQSLTEPRLSEVLEYHSKYERAWRDTMVDGADAGQFRPYDHVTLKAVLGMYFYGYLWMTPGRAPTAEVIAERVNELALRMLKAA
ncbi:MAG TPA: TetR/AcrR family transcriptional regulator [Roseateles sp.]|uniref:TetR/AcrR family transcriptional regulator n=1 Tax=Roseateles sp. TaxID=1971397 RepID=UPI002EDA8CB3